MAVSLLSRFIRSLSLLGVVLGLLFCAASLSPSLLPRPFVVQGVLSGVVFAVGYSLGWSTRWLWVYLGLPVLPDRIRFWVGAPVTAFAFGTLAYTLGNVTEWQNTLRALMEMEPVSSAHADVVMFHGRCALRWRCVHCVNRSIACREGAWTAWPSCHHPPSPKLLLLLILLPTSGCRCHQGTVRLATAYLYPVVTLSRVPITWQVRVATARRTM